MAQFNYTANVNDTYEGFELIPAGTYQAIISDSSIVVPKSGVGQMLKMTVEIINHPTLNGRKIFENLCIQHKKQQAEEIAKRKLNSYCAATGVITLNDSMELHNKPFGIKVGIRKGQNGYGDANEIQKIMSLKDMGGAASSAPVQQGSENKPSFLR